MGTGLPFQFCFLRKRPPFGGRPGHVTAAPSGFPLAPSPGGTSVLLLLPVSPCSRTSCPWLDLRVSGTGTGDSPPPAGPGFGAGLGSPELSQRWEPLLLPPLSLLPLVEAASLVGICCCTAACRWIWLVVLSSWMGTSLLVGRLSAGALSRRATSGRSTYSGPAPESSRLPRGPGVLAEARGPSCPSPLKLGG